MDALHFHSVFLHAGFARFNIFESHDNRRNCTKFPSKAVRLVPLASNRSETSPVENGPPLVELEFVGPQQDSGGTPKVQKATAISGEKLLRNIMLDSKIELYGPYGKVMNCGGGGSCGTCIVEIVEGEELLSRRTGSEQRYLKKKPETWRLACQTFVGNKENSGKVVVQRLPQWKKK